MARKTSTTEINPMPEINQQAFQEDANALTVLGDIAQGMQEERDLVNQLLGQAQMADAFTQFSLTVRTSKLAYVKETKLYRALKGKKSPDGQGFLSGSWEEFCNLLGRSVAQVDEDIANLRALGEEALDSMSRMGIGYRELRQYRKLPDDQKTALLEVAKSGDKEAFVDLAEELIAKNAKDKEALAQQLDNVNADYEAQSKVLADTSSKLQDTKLELEKTRRLVAARTPDEKITAIREEATKLATEAEVAVACKLRPAVEALVAHADEEGADHRAVIAGLLAQVERAVSSIRLEYGIPTTPDADATPEWMRDGADTHVAKALAGA
ncbi:hypothetical protein LOY46_11170 [Pseudomonas sichuanensis]|uniref:hypothetical protein n=1 Tax=Pseudomonas sichuanensis TaxID=2213015 RepID=UPI00215F230C|nr:hypothetical protein [Pseudomonas sichuanensis]UVK85204.1 hypothetical protein LOY46_11170 [Pseudomonas sichuanensis]